MENARHEAIKAAYGERKKYIKVPVSDRLPEKGINSILLWNENPELVAKGYVSKFGNLIIHGNVDYEGKPDLYLEEVPDHSEEMLSLLEKSRKIIQSLKLSMLVHPDCEEGSEFDDYTTSAQETENQIEELINKVKDNGK
ncbi:hypothetical protein CMU02_08985 [Elizabethkingia anophelis]|uniref:hypothetical protein n=1 Tax=Elizabethkingia anophelis TaxID=1117645 RepID=UPI00293CD836|nr:hypothetical protein [Elizabethkingia anophelis]MDV3904945.1 hypothetical protein [Elizabethkingia anophelis]